MKGVVPDVFFSIHALERALENGVCFLWKMGNEMKIELDRRADLLYVRFDPRSQEVTNMRVSQDIVLDVGPGEKIVGIEIMNASKKVDLTQLQPVNFEIVG